MPASERTAMGEKGRLYAVEHLNYHTLSEQFLTLTA